MKRKARGQEQGADWFRRKPIKAWLRGPVFLCLPKSALFFWTVHGPFSFRHDEKKMGGGSRPPMAMGAEPVPRARGDEIPPADAIEKMKDFLQNPG